LLLGDEYAGMARSPPVNQARYGQVVDFYDYARASVPHPRRNRREEVWQPLITDDLPDRIPITDVELDILEAHFADLLDELFGARR
jgi:hypothetical protein